MKFYYTLDFDKIDFREQPELYRVGRGEQHALLAATDAARRKV